MLRVYISGPITKGCRNWNLYQSLVAEEKLMRAGFAVYNPMPSMQRPFNVPSPENYEMYLGQDFAWIEVCHAVLVLPGESSGVQREVDFATLIGVRVFYDIEDLIKDLGKDEPR